MSRAELRERGIEIRRALFGAHAESAALTAPVAGFPELMAELAYGSIWSRPGLTKPDRMACTLAALCAAQSLTALAPHVRAALDIGMTPTAIVEIFIQDGIYRGFTASEAALDIALRVFADRGLDFAAPDAQPEASLEALMDLGRQLQADLHGARKDQDHAAPDNPVTGTIYPLIVQYCYGAIWHRPGLDRRTRALCAVAAFTALGRDLLLRKFALSALNVGATQAEVIEAVIQTGPYSGFAFMLNGLSQVGEAFGAVSPQSAWSQPR
jgi:alkylhydroperoxidase/carboxymuconolactone decarboxylase family protein YurZ